jgi:hypothetical protein
MNFASLSTKLIFGMDFKFLCRALILLYFSFLFSESQLLAIDYQKVIDHTNNTPTTVSNSTNALSAYLCKPFSNDNEKFAAIFFWVAKNISYNHSLAAKNLYYEDVDEIVNHVIKTKNGVCQHYSELIARLCQHAGLTAFVVGGYTRINGKVDEISHAWNIIKVNGKWYFLDATWAKPEIQKGNRIEFPKEFFMISPEENIKTRMPFDPIWQALSKPLKYHEFDQGLVNNLKKGNFNYNDSIFNYVNLNQTEQYQAKVNRIRKNGIHNKIIKKEYALMKENYKMLLYNLEVDKYNAAAGFYNNGMRFYNEYAELKNNKNRYLSKTKKQLIAVIDSSLINLKKAQNLSSEIKGDAEMQEYIINSGKNIKKVKALLLREKQLIETNF